MATTTSYIKNQSVSSGVSVVFCRRSGTWAVSDNGFQLGEYDSEDAAWRAWLDTQLPGILEIVDGYGNRRALSGALIYAFDGVRRQSRNVWLVKNEYEVRVGGAHWTCTCPDHTYRRNHCKHIMACKISGDHK